MRGTRMVGTAQSLSHADSTKEEVFGLLVPASVLSQATQRIQRLGYIRVGVAKQLLTNCQRPSVGDPWSKHPKEEEECEREFLT